MSSTFDEGGAKGMLLANLEVSSNGVGIVFDSKEDKNADKVKEEGTTGDAEEVSDGLGADGLRTIYLRPKPNDLTLSLPSPSLLPRHRRRSRRR